MQRKDYFRHMLKEILNKIKEYKTIIIHRHTRPDMDAIGSQIGLAAILKENYKDKDIYVVGDLNKMSFNSKMDEINDALYNDALVIITDVAGSHMISDDRYKLAKERIIIDHHQNGTDLDNVSLFYSDPSYSSACELIIEIARFNNLKINKEAATYLYAGMVTDTGRFQFMHNPARTFELASFITSFDPDIKGFYDYIYTETLEARKTKNLFIDFELSDLGIAYRKNTKDIIDKSGLDFYSVSRGMVNLMAGIKEIPIWANFTEDVNNNTVVAEIRSRGITVVDIAKKYCGGGHKEACGATLKSFEEADKMIYDLGLRKKENE